MLADRIHGGERSGAAEVGNGCGCGLCVGRTRQAGRLACCFGGAQQGRRGDGGTEEASEGLNDHPCFRTREQNEGVFSPSKF